LLGTAVLGQIFVHLGWPATVLGIATLLCAAAAFTARLPADHP